MLSSITKNGKIERASRPPCGFSRIDDQQLEVYPFAKSFVEYFIQKGNMNDLLTIICPTMKKKGNSHEEL
jgi:hypothetical protein